MRLGQLAMLNRLATEREGLINQRSQIINGRGLAVTYNGTHCDGELLELVRPVVIGNLSGRIRAIDADLAAIGVDLS